MKIWKCYNQPSNHPAMFDELESEEIQRGRVESLHKTSIWMNFKPKNMKIVTHQLQADLSSNYCKKS